MPLEKFFWGILVPIVELWKLIKRRIHAVRLASKVPGMSSLPLCGDVYWNCKPTPEEIMDCTYSMWRKFGEIFRAYVGPKIVIIATNWMNSELLLSSHDYVAKGLLYSFLRPWLGDGLLLSTGEKWRTRRKILTPAFHFKILDQFIPVFNKCGDEFVRLMRKRAGGEAFDVWFPVKLLTLDVICETTMGVRMEAQTHNKSEYVNAVNEMSHLVYEYATKPWLYVNFIFKRTRIGQRYKECLEILHNTTHQVIKERREELNKIDSWSSLDIDDIGLRKRVAFLDLLLLAARDGSLTDSDIREEVDTFMFEGHDTTAAGISFTLYLLSLHNNIQDKILEELEAVFDPSKPLEPTLQELSELKYLEMVIKESLRMYPPVPAISREITKDLDLITDSAPMTAPETSEMFLSFYLLHQNTKVFPDPETFDPERFSADECARRNPFAYLPFSAGPRNCIGQRFAMLEMKNIVAKVIWNFRLLPDPTYTPIIIWELILKSKNGIFLKLENRERSIYDVSN